MQTSITFRNLEPSDHYKSYVPAKLDRLDKMLHHPASANVVLRLEKGRSLAEAKLLSGKLELFATAEDENMQIAVDQMLGNIKEQLIKQKKKMQTHRQRGHKPEPDMLDMGAAPTE